VAAFLLECFSDTKCTQTLAAEVRVHMFQLAKVCGLCVCMCCVCLCVFVCMYVLVVLSLSLSLSLSEVVIIYSYYSLHALYPCISLSSD
jgi:hypothetical protein